jgi:hypothetical protein
MVSKAWRAAVLAACVCIGGCIVGPEAVKTAGMRNGGECVFWRESFRCPGVPVLEPWLEQSPVSGYGGSR